MYGEQDYIDIERRIRRNRLVWLPVLACIAALFVLALAKRVQWLAYAAGIGFAVVACFAFAFHQLPCLNYRKFLREMDSGLSREMAGQVVSISDQVDLQDGARVLPVRSGGSAGRGAGAARSPAAGRGAGRAHRLPQRLQARPLPRPRRPRPLKALRAAHPGGRAEDCLA